jgi:hypothetical protein
MKADEQFGFNLVMSFEPLSKIARGSKEFRAS